MVHAGERGIGKLKVLDAATKLKKYSIDKIKKDVNSNGNGFPKSTRWLYAIPIGKAVRSICSNIRCANELRTDSPIESDYRLKYQLEARCSLATLTELVEDSYNANYISDKQCSYWASLIAETQDLLRAWIRYK